MTRKYSEIRKDENDCLVAISRQLDELRKLVLEAGDSLNLGDELTNRSYVITMFKDLKNVWLAAFGFSVKHTADGPDSRLDLHHDNLYYFNLNK